MQQHVKNYFEYFGYGIDDKFNCEYCQSIGLFTYACDVHHVLERSKFGKKRKNEQDNVNNLIGLCRLHHNQAHDRIISRETLFEIIANRR